MKTQLSPALVLRGVSAALGLAALAAAPIARAQSAPPPSGAAAPIESPAPASTEIDVLFPYAFRFNTTGIVADAGSNWGGHFIGGEFSYFDARPNAYAWYDPAGAFDGNVQYRENIYTLNLAYRYTFAIWHPAGPNSLAPLEGYIGGAAGAAYLNYNPYNAGPGFTNGPDYGNHSRWRLDANGVAGLQWNFTPAVGLRVGYRYIWISRGRQFYNTTSFDSGALEAGLAYRF
ncbi:MAG TPA: outer membrane beta-barrel protein [Opitutaceae bacterium]|jgi:opacity protein-like surface antigen